MTIRIQIILIILTIMFLVYLIRKIKKSKMTTDFATVWILFGMSLIFIAVLPQTIYFLSNLLGVASPMNALFIILIFLLLCLIFYLSMKISTLENKLSDLIQKEGIYRKKD